MWSCYVIAAARRARHGRSAARSSQACLWRPPHKKGPRPPASRQQFHPYSSTPAPWRGAQQALPPLPLAFRFLLIAEAMAAAVALGSKGATFRLRWGKGGYHHCARAWGGSGGTGRRAVSAAPAPVAAPKLRALRARALPDDAGAIQGAAGPARARAVAQHRRVLLRTSSTAAPLMQAAPCLTPPGAHCPHCMSCCVALLACGLRPGRGTRPHARGAARQRAVLTPLTVHPVHHMRPFMAAV
jgi:hypothetical protein